MCIVHAFLKRARPCPMASIGMWPIKMASSTRVYTPTTSQLWHRTYIGRAGCLSCDSKRTVRKELETWAAGAGLGTNYTILLAGNCMVSALGYIWSDSYKHI